MSSSERHLSHNTYSQGILIHKSDQSTTSLPQNTSQSRHAHTIRVNLTTKTRPWWLLEWDCSDAFQSDLAKRRNFAQFKPLKFCSQSFLLLVRPFEEISGKEACLQATLAHLGGKTLNILQGLPLTFSVTTLSGLGRSSQWPNDVIYCKNEDLARLKFKYFGAFEQEFLWLGRDS